MENIKNKIDEIFSSEKMDDLFKKEEPTPAEQAQPEVEETQEEK